MLTAWCTVLCDRARMCCFKICHELNIFSPWFFVYLMLSRFLFLSLQSNTKTNPPDISDLTDIGFRGSCGGDDSSSAEEANLARYQRLLDHISAFDELPSEKRSARREATLKHMFRAISHYATGESGRTLLQNRQDEIRTACFYCLRSGAAIAAEQYAACRVLEVVSVVLGGDQDEYYESIDKTLRRIVMTTVSRATPVRVAALRTLALTNVICATYQESAEALMDFCEEVAAKEYRNHPVPDILRAAALDCWTLIGSTIPDIHLAGQDDFMIGRGLAILELLKDCLDSPAIELRSAAGECLALIHEARIDLGIAGDGGDKNTTARQFAKGTWEGSDWEVLMDEVKQRIAELSTESGHHMSKKMKKQQRATFREFMSTIVDDETPEEIVSFPGGSIELHTWKEIVQLNFIRHCTQGGFQVQLLTNETLQDMFGADGQLLNARSDMSQLEKRLVLSKTSTAAKNADKELARQRRQKDNAKNYFITADEDGI